MTRRRKPAGMIFALTAILGGCAQSKTSQWSGTWKSVGGEPNGTLQCEVENTGDASWRATFTGYCNREFAYKVAMHGREKQKKIFFQGQADLGEKDGGVYTWTGLIDGSKFTGQYSGARGKKAGEFWMRPKR